jgi:hypothetical protein
MNGDSETCEVFTPHVGVGAKIAPERVQNRGLALPCIDSENIE